VRISGVHLGVDAGVVVENAGENIGGLPRRAGDDLGAVYAKAIAEMAVDAHGPVVIAEVPRMIGADQGSRRRGKALAIGR
jgi:hypothetical protein